MPQPPSTPSAVRAAALLGAAGGLRTAMPWGALAVRERLGRGATARFVPLAAAAGELVIDKLPQTPSRTSPPGLAGRLGSSAGAGWLIAGAPGAAAASAAAGLSAFVGERTRAAIGRRTGLPDPLIAVVEDLLAIGVALAATRQAADAG
ncbi:MAG TPA: hypothetical protein VKB25_05710 [Conexibacter sp.]|nr:hypothetical protein [Conexibacter sp.]